MRWNPLICDQKRVSAVRALAGASVFLAVGAWLEPDPRGLGTHEQLGLPACPFRALFGIPCPLCGATTAFALGVRLRVLEAFACHPAGPLLALGLVLVAALSTAQLASGRDLLAGPRRMLLRPATLLLVIAALLVRWAVHA